MRRVVIGIIFVVTTLLLNVILFNYTNSITTLALLGQALLGIFVQLFIALPLFGLSVVFFFRETREYIANIADDNNTLSPSSQKSIVNNNKTDKSQAIENKIGCGVSIILNIVQLLFGILLIFIGGFLMVFDITHSNPKDIPTIIIHILLIFVALKVGLKLVISVFKDLIGSDGC